MTNFSGVSTNLLLGLAIALASLLVLEIVLRVFFGFGKPPIYVADSEIGYLLAPNQRTRRFGNRIAINQYSMRSPPIAPERPASTLRVLMLGDSIVNGGWWTDQAGTISELLRTQLTDAVASPADLTRPFQQVEVLNASANSWAPRNELAYLQRLGSFEAQAILLVINTDDLFGDKPTPKPVGRDRNYPHRYPFLTLALAEIFSRYLLPRLPLLAPPPYEPPPREPGNPVDRNLEAIGEIAAYACQQNAQFLLAMTPLLREVGSPGPLDYEIEARQQLQTFTQAEAIDYIDFLPQFNAEKQPELLYRDHIHLSPKGNAMVSNALGKSLLSLQWRQTTPPS